MAVYLKDVGGSASDGQWDECWVPCSKGDPGAVEFIRALPPSFVGQGLGSSRDLKQAAGVKLEAMDIAQRLRGRYAKGPIMPDGEPEFGYAVFTEMPDGRPFPGLYGQAAEMIDRLLVILSAATASPAERSDRTRETDKNDPREEQSDAGEGA
jgi:hypothetical protein